MDRDRQRVLQQLQAEVRSGRYHPDPGKLAAAVVQHLSADQASIPQDVCYAFDKVLFSNDGHRPRRSERRPSISSGKGGAASVPNDSSFEVHPPQTLRRGRTRELAQRKADEADSASALRAFFLESLPHELRTPLNAVIGFSDLLLQDRAALSAEQSRALEDILSSGRRLLALINPLVDLATLSPGRLLLELDSLDPAEQVRGACALAAPLLQKKRLQLDLDLGGSRRPLQADRRHLQQILLQLLAGALRRSPDGAHLALRVDDLDGLVRFELEDHGAADGGDDRGIAVIRRLVERHGGELHLEATPGGGQTAWFALPVSGPSEAAEPALKALRKGAVLLVDDDATNRTLARLLLKRRGYRVLLAESGAEAVRLARSERCALVLLDLAMPRLDGFETARQLRADPATAAIPLVAFTAMATLRDDERVRRAGFDGYLSKPVETAALEATLARFVDPEAAE